MRKYYLLAFDVTVFGVTPILALWLRDNFTITSNKLFGILPYMVWGIATATVCFVIIGTHRSVWRYVSLHDFGRIFAAVTLSISTTVLIVFALNRGEGIARSIPLIHWLLVISIMCLARISVRLLSKHSNGSIPSKSLPRNRHDILVVGTSPLTALYLRSADEIQSNDLNILGILAEDDHLFGRSIHGRTVLGSPADLPQILARFNVHGVQIKHVIITIPFADLSDRSREMLVRFKTNGTISVHMFEDGISFKEFDPEMQNQKQIIAVDEQQDSPMPIEIDAVQFNSGYHSLKRLFDVVGAFLCLIIFSPLILLTCFLVALDLGFPLTFWQQRPGKDMRNFKLYKFRTMSEAIDRSGNRLVDEERLSGIGKFLRKTRMDEFPQLYNILVGEMSFVGPRPLLPIDQPFAMNERLAVRPGLTGWAQVHGGKIVHPTDKVMLDLWYIQNASFWLDTKIFFKTIVMIIKGENLNLKKVKEAYEALGFIRSINQKNSDIVLKRNLDQTENIQLNQNIA